MAHSSTLLALNAKAPDFALLDTLSGKLYSLSDVASPNATVIMFISNHCPYVQHILEAVVRLAKAYQQKGVNFVAISSNNAAAYPQDGPEKMKEVAQMYGFSFPYLYDQTQQVARTYRAECTPEFFVFNGSMRLAYHGQFDDSRPGGKQPVTGQSLANALDALLSSMPVPAPQVPSIGCSIKWLPA